MTSETVPPMSVRVLIVDGDAGARALLAGQLTETGHTVVAQASSGAEAVALAAELSPEVVLLEVQLPDGSGVAAAGLITRGSPTSGVVLVAGNPETVLTDDDVTATGAFAVLPKPAPRCIVECTVRLAAARARELASARYEAGTARRQLEERKVIERAKGILMRRTGSSEQEAYRILQRSSQDRATPMIALARAVLASEPGVTATR